MIHVTHRFEVWVPGERPRAVDLEEHTLESLSDRCEECGTKLTAREMELALERGGPVLCSVHAADVAPLEDDAGDEPVA